MKGRYVLGCLLSLLFAYGQPSIGLLTVEYQPPSPPPWGFLCHCLPSTVSPELMGTFLTLAEGDTMTAAAIQRDWLRLQSSAAFASVAYRIDTLGDNIVELRWIVTPRCLHALMPEVTVGANVGNGGLALQLSHIWGMGERLLLRLRYRWELSLRWDADADLFLPLAKSIELNANAHLHRYRRTYTLRLSSPLSHPTFPWGWGAQWGREQGTSWDFRGQDFPPYRRHSHHLTAWFRWGTQQQDQLFITIAAIAQPASTDPGYRQAFDDTALLLFGIGSLAQRPHSVPSPYVAAESCAVVTGAWGAVTLGIGFPIGPTGERLSYIGGELEQSLGKEWLLLSGRIAAGNAFVQRIPRYTALETSLSGWLAFPATPLLLFWEGYHCNVWNWPAYRAERLDFLSGFPAPFPSPAADNRMELRTELRWRGKAFEREADWTLSLFHHVGTIWNQGIRLTHARFQNVVGAGIRMHIGRKHLLQWGIRAEVGYSFTLHRVLPTLRIELSDLPKTLHRYRLPQPLGKPQVAAP